MPVFLFLPLLVLAYWKLGSVSLGGKAELLGLIGALVTIAALPYLDRHPYGGSLLLLGTLASTVALTSNAHDMGMKTYHEPYGKIGARQLGLTTESRVLSSDNPVFLG